MRKVLPLIFILFLATSAYAAITNWHTANSVLIAWDVVTHTSDNKVIPDTDKVEYEVFAALVDQKDQAVSQGYSSDNKHTVTFTAEGQYIIGVQSIRKRGDQELGRSAIIWSDEDTAVAEGKTFGVLYFAPPLTPGGLRQG